jgi:WD40 repeat protein
VISAAFSPDGKRVVTASGDNTARVWSADGKGEPVVLRGHASVVTSAAFSPDGKWVVTASGDKTARVWSADGKDKPVVLRGHASVVTSAAFSPEGKRVVTASADKARIWTVGIAELQGLLHTATSICLDPDQRQRFLAESPEESHSGYVQCERAQRRRPHFPPGEAVVGMPLNPREGP